MNRRFSYDSVSKIQSPTCIIGNGPSPYECKSLLIDKSIKCRTQSDDDNKREYRKKICCTNCGKPGHEFKQCIEPTTSFGVIDIRISGLRDNALYMKDQFSTKKNTHFKVMSEKYPDVKCYISDNIKLYEENKDSYILDSDSIPFENEEQIERFSYYRNKIKFLMVSRKFSLGFVEFVRGKYDPYDARGIIKLFEQMTKDEIDIVANNNYDGVVYKFLARDGEDMTILLDRIYQGRYSSEYCDAKVKFNMLLCGSDQVSIPFNLYFYTKQIKPKWAHKEWGFPKGRRDNRCEENLTCACREFEEETGYRKEDYCILNKIEPLEEKLVGTNGVTYKHIYYLALDESNTDDAPNQMDYYEIGEVKWFTYDEAMFFIRPYHMDKKKILTKVYLFLLNYLIDSNK